MPGQEIAQANPPADASLLPDSVLDLHIHLDNKNILTDDELASIRKFRRAADYIAAAMIFLKSNALVERKLTFDDIKPRLLGHWGTCPGLVLVYAHLNRIIRKQGTDMLYVVGPGHGAPGLLACLWLEDSLSRFIPEYTRDKTGLERLITKFSVPGGFPSHINAEVPGSIHEGGELGYALSVSFGAVMDKPDLVIACVVGDGEAETGPTATAWHAYKYIDPAESGAVLPIVHVNGFKISERTIYGTMDNKELIALFSGYGYQVRIVEDLQNIDQDLAGSMEWALGEIRRIQRAARSGQPIVKPRWPVLIMRTPKGWTGPKEVHGKIIEGSYASHQVPLPKAKSDDVELQALQDWLASYNPHELFQIKADVLAHDDWHPVDAILSIIPETAATKLGQKKEVYAGYEPLRVPSWMERGVEKGQQASCMQAVGGLLKAVIAENPTSFRIFSPDELVSNKLDAVLDDTGRNFQWDVASRANGGRVIEILSEHTCQGMLQGYTLTGRTGLFPSYEAFLGIVQTMCAQYSKFVKMARETKWRQDVGSLNYLETSTWARQEHNGFSHQNPSFIGAVLNLKASIARVYLPPDANCFLSTVAHCLRAKNYINLMVGSKQPTPVWLSPEEADKHCIAGASIWKFASVDEGKSPDVVLVGIGVEVTFEVIAAAALLRKHVPALRVRVVNVTDLMILALEGSHPHALTREDFDALFTADRPVHFNFHGYPIELKGLLFGRSRLERVTMEGYNEEGTTTSPFDMMLCNKTSRYHVAAAAIRAGAKHNPAVAVDSHEMAMFMMHMAAKDREYIYQNREDPKETFDTPKFA
ncbi:D-xylulose 5-phosphate/D-fructose 6-phosphate phosphoketolase [Athelia psychrophila]|uniref:D-xylulose 5-phosphate/D-fructose 6-phosphate phosphoketolase n=1 Tax=Athelia psychrophila TaxID=1759441 RepID=A0A166UFS0_9AGAM|nr:D-xylulose 5-phosphate/D-fructose 6-phosphate phosphoketolase [Fibularhizoctonia sp. CBS 109695]